MALTRELRQRDFFVTRPLGTGHSNPHDVLRTRAALNVTGHAHSPPNPSKIFDPSLIRSLDDFQRDWGLKRDSIIEPGGPTESTLELAVAATRAGGSDGADLLRGPLSVLNRQGIRFDLDPDDTSGPVLWRDRDGNRIPLTTIRSLLAKADASDQPETARRFIQLAAASGASSTMSDAVPPHVANNPALQALSARIFGDGLLGSSDARSPSTSSEPSTLGNFRTSQAQPPRSRGNSSPPRPAPSGQPPQTSPAPVDAKLPGILNMEVGITLARIREGSDEIFIDNTEKAYWELVRIGRERGWNQAADNLERFLSGSGKELNFSREQARSFDPIRRAERENIHRFTTETFLAKAGYKKTNDKLKGLKDGGCYRIQDPEHDHWDRQYEIPGTLGNLAAGEVDFVLAFGRTGLKSVPDVEARRIGDRIVFEGTVKHTWDDPYDFEKGQTLADGALALQKYRGAKPFKIHSSWTQHVTGTVDIRNGELVNPRFQWQDVN